MSKWLAAAVAQLANPDPSLRPIVPIVSKSPIGESFGANDTIGTETLDGSSGSEPFSTELEALLAANPTDDERRWRQACTDASRFLRCWGQQALVLGWTAEDLFGLDRVAPLARYDAMGLVWLSAGCRVRLLDRTWATFNNGLRFYRQLKSTTRDSSTT